MTKSRLMKKDKRLKIYQLAGFFMIFISHKSPFNNQAYPCFQTYTKCIYTIYKKHLSGYLKHLTYFVIMIKVFIWYLAFYSNLYLIAFDSPFFNYVSSN